MNQGKRAAVIGDGGDHGIVEVQLLPTVCECEVVSGQWAVGLQ